MKKWFVVPLMAIACAFPVAISLTGCEDSGGQSSGNCTENAKQLKLGMSTAQCIDVMGSPDSNQASYDGSERQLLWQCGTHTVMVDLQLDRAFIIIIDGVAQSGSWSAQDGYSY